MSGAPWATAPTTSSSRPPDSRPVPRALSSSRARPPLPLRSSSATSSGRPPPRPPPRGRGGGRPPPPRRPPLVGCPRDHPHEGRLRPRPPSGQQPVAAPVGPRLLRLRDDVERDEQERHRPLRDVPVPGLAPPG